MTKIRYQIFDTHSSERGINLYSGNLHYSLYDYTGKRWLNRARQYFGKGSGWPDKEPQIYLKELRF